MSTILPMSRAHVGAAPPCGKLLRALHAAFLEAHVAGVDMEALRQLTLRSLRDGADPQGRDAALLARASVVLDEALAAIPAADQASAPRVTTAALDGPLMG